MRPEWEDALRRGRKTIDARPVADDIAGLGGCPRISQPCVGHDTYTKCMLPDANPVIWEK
jgi:hypothetical protein